MGTKVGYKDKKRAGGKKGSGSNAHPGAKVLGHPLKGEPSEKA